MSETSNASAPASSSTTPNHSGETSQEQGQENQQTSSQTTPPAKKKFKYKADNQEFEEELDDSELANRLSLAKAANKRMQEASMTKKQVSEFVKQLKEDPMSVLSDDRIVGAKKFREIAEQFLLKQIEEETLTPEERQSRDKDRKLQEYERKEKEALTQREQKEVQALEQQYTQQFEKTIMTALSSSNLPKNAFTVKRMAELMQKNLQHGLDLAPEQLAQLVKEDYQNEQKSLVGSASAEQLIAMFGEDMINKIRKHDLSKFSQKNPEPKQSSKEENLPPRKMNSREYDEWLRAKWQKK